MVQVPTQMAVACAELVLQESLEFLRAAKGTTLRFRQHDELEKQIFHTRLLLSRWWNVIQKAQRNSGTLPSPVKLKSGS